MGVSGRRPPPAAGIRQPREGSDGGRPTNPRTGRHLFAAYDLSTDKLYGHIKANKRRTDFLIFMRYV